MKKFSLFMLTLLTITTTISVTAFGQKGATQQITIDAKGQLLNAAGTKLGYITKSDVVRDNTGKGLYTVDMDGKVMAADGRQLGTVKTNGAFFNTAGQPLLTTKDAGKDKYLIVDATGHNLGTTHKNYKRHACAAQCYWLTAAR
jgi:hypothetical protein